jgi:hypothetical protein
MSRVLMEHVTARHEVETAAAELHVAGLRLSDENASALAVNKAQDALAFAARRLARAVDALPLERQPRGWAETSPDLCITASRGGNFPAAESGDAR